jgi:hypothetical protein
VVAEPPAPPVLVVLVVVVLAPPVPAPPPLDVELDEEVVNEMSLLPQPGAVEAAPRAATTAAAR